MIYIKRHWSRILYFSLILCSLCGCATTVRKSSQFNETFPRIKTVAVLPADIKVYKITVGGVTELIDEWSDRAKELIRNDLKNDLTNKNRLNVKFIDEDWLKQKDKETWMRNKGLFSAISLSALQHAYGTVNGFDTKIKNFDYSLGSEIGNLSKLCEADALLFVYGFDYEATSGRKALWWWGFSLGIATGIMYLPQEPSELIMALIDAHTGDVLMFKTTTPEANLSFVNPKDMDNLIQWFLKDFQIKK